MRRQVAADTGTTSATSLPAGRTSVSSQNFNAVSASTPTNSIKKCFSISDILRFHLIFNNSNDLFFLNYIDYIEESCAKSYINGVIHYLGLHATQKIERPFPMQLEQLAATSEQSPVQQFEMKSINQLLKIGRKIKLVDLNLTDYLKMICMHVKNGKLKQGDKVTQSTDLTNEKVNVSDQNSFLTIFHC